MKNYSTDLFDELAENMDVHIQESGRKIFVNRNLKMHKVNMIGFDMDYTLAAYNKLEIETLQYNLVKERLVNELHFPKELLLYEYIQNLVVLGLSLDLKNGNLIKIDRYNFVTRGYHGTQKLNYDALHQIYRDKNTPINLDRDVIRIDTLFSLPETSLFCQIVDEYQPGSFYKDYRTLYKQIRQMVDLMHQDDSLKTIIRENVGNYIHKDIDLPLTLHNFRISGKKLFLLTNSYYGYTNDVMHYMLDGALPEYANWQDYFDLIVVGSRKPLYFGEGTPLIPLNPDGTHAAESPENKIFQGGNIEHLEQFTGLRGERVLYIGDHIYGDILKVKKSSLWRTCLIVEDLEREVTINDKNRDLFQSLKNYDFKINILDSELNYQKMIMQSLKNNLDAPLRLISSLEKKVFEDLIQKSRKKISKLSNMLEKVSRDYHLLRSTIDKEYNPYWGMIFKEGREKTKFADQLEHFSCLYTSRVANFLFYSPTQYFRSPMDVMAHELF